MSGAADDPRDLCKKNQKAPESVRTSGIALRRLWALRSYNRWVRIWFQPIKVTVPTNSVTLEPAERKGPAQSGGANRSPNVDVDAGTRPSDLNTRLSYAAALLDCYTRSRTPLPTVMSRSRWTHCLLHSGPTQSFLQIRSALAGNESAAEPAIAIAIAKT